jgi:hypothetical protein
MYCQAGFGRLKIWDRLRLVGWAERRDQREIILKGPDVSKFHEFSRTIKWSYYERLNREPGAPQAATEMQPPHASNC